MVLSRSKIFLFCLLSFILGIGAASLVTIEFVYLYGAFLLILIIFVVFWRKRNYRIAALVAVFFIFGVFRFLLSQPSDDSSQNISYYNGQKVVLTGVVATEPDTRLDSQRLTVASIVIASEVPRSGTKRSNLNNAPGDNQIASVASLPRNDISGRLLIKTSLYPQYQYGDLLKVSCQLEAPGQIEDFAYDKYLARYDIYSLCRYAQIERTDSNRGNPILSIIFKIKAKFIGAINQSLPEPHASLAAGILIGARRGIPQNLLDDFSRTGITHIIAISGSNITIIVGAVIALLSFWGASRRMVFWLASLGIIFFVLMTGASASVVRAAVMAMMVLFARGLGRASRAGNALLLAAFIMLIINPKILVFDLGFQLSFLATAGLVYINPILDRFTKNWPKAFGIKDVLITTVSAIIATTPLVLYQFGRLSLIAPLANLLVVPLVPLSMALGFATGIGGMIWLPLGQILGYASWLLLEYIIRVTEFLSQLPLASLELGGFHWLLALALYGIIGWWIWRKKDVIPAKAGIH